MHRQVDRQASPRSRIDPWIASSLEADARRKREGKSPGRLASGRSTTIKSDLATYYKQSDTVHNDADVDPQWTWSLEHGWTWSQQKAETTTEKGPGARFSTPERNREGLPQAGAAGSVYHSIISMQAGKNFVDKLGESGEVPLPGKRRSQKSLQKPKNSSPQRVRVTARTAVPAEVLAMAKATGRPVTPKRVYPGGRPLDDKSGMYLMVQEDLRRVNGHLVSAVSRSSTPGTLGRKTPQETRDFLELKERQLAALQAENTRFGPGETNATVEAAANWEERLWHDGRTYFLNRHTREKQWNRPQAECVPLHTTWIQRQDTQTGRYYYYDASTQMTQWKVPEAGFEYIWEERVQRTSGQFYYANRVTNATQWEEPASLEEGGPGFDMVPDEAAEVDIEYV